MRAGTFAHLCSLDPPMHQPSRPVLIASWRCSAQRDVSQHETQESSAQTGPLFETGPFFGGAGKTWAVSVHSTDTNRRLTPPVPPTAYSRPRHQPLLRQLTKPR